MSLGFATVRMKDGRIQTIGRDQHFVDLIRDYMGNDCADWYESRIKGLAMRANELAEIIDYDEIDKPTGDREYMRTLEEAEADFVQFKKNMSQEIKNLVVIE